LQIALLKEPNFTLWSRTKTSFRKKTGFWIWFS